MFKKVSGDLWTGVSTKYLCRRSATEKCPYPRAHRQPANSYAFFALPVKSRQRSSSARGTVPTMEKC